MSGAALGLVIFAVTTGGQTNLPDEGVAARLFQLLILAQAPLMLIFLATADWVRWKRIAALVALQVAGVAVALETLLYFEL